MVQQMVDTKLMTRETYTLYGIEGDFANKDGKLTFTEKVCKKQKHVSLSVYVLRLQGTLKRIYMSSYWWGNCSCFYVRFGVHEWVHIMTELIGCCLWEKLLHVLCEVMADMCACVFVLQGTLKEDSQLLIYGLIDLIAFSFVGTTAHVLSLRGVNRIPGYSIVLTGV